MTHQCDLVDSRFILNVTCNVAIPVIRIDKAGRAWTIKVAGDTQQWYDILMIDCGPATDFTEAPLRQNV